MAIKRILLPIANSENLSHLVEAAFAVGQRFGAEVQGLYVEPVPRTVFYSAEYIDPQIEEMILENARKDMVRRRTQASDLFSSVAKRFENSVSQFRGEEGNVEELTARSARVADLSLLGLGAAYEQPGWENMRNAALFRSGRPVLFVPPLGLEASRFERVVIAWKDSIEAARAAAAVQPLLLSSTEVHVITVGESDETVVSLQDVEQYLQLHYSEVKSEAIQRSDKPVGEVLLERAEALGAVLVMGAYSHWRWREQLFGGITEFVLHHAHTPVLMAH